MVGSVKARYSADQAADFASDYGQLTADQQAQYEKLLDESEKAPAVHDRLEIARLDRVVAQLRDELHEMTMARDEACEIALKLQRYSLEVEARLEQLGKVGR